MVLVTGASGFIGGKLAERLVSDGYSVRCVYRRLEIPDHLKKLEERGARLFRADLTDISVYSEMLRGVTTIFHAAALASDWGAYEDFERANIDVADNLLRFGLKDKVRKVIVLSSISVHGFGRHNHTGENGPYYKPVSAYQKSKLEMEKRVLAYNCTSMAVSVIRPGNVYGPGDHTTMYPIFEAMEKGYMGYLDGGERKTCPVYIDDLLHALILAWKNKKANGEIFNITGGEDITWKTLLDYSAEELQIKKPRLNLNSGIAMPISIILEFLFRIFRSPIAPPLTKYRVSQLMFDYNFSIEKAEKILSFFPDTDYRAGIKKTVSAFRAG